MTLQVLQRVGAAHQESGTFRNTSFDLEPGTPPCMVILCIKMGSIHMPSILSNLLHMLNYRP